MKTLNRKTFIKVCGMGCLGVAGIALLQSCAVTRYFDAAIIDTDLVVPLTAFEEKTKGETKIYQYIIAQNERLQYPVCIYRFSATEYSALLMQCTHQNAELQVFGDRLQCPAHGSEFSNRGQVQNGPADMPLRTFPVRIENTTLKINLK